MSRSVPIDSPIRPAPSPSSGGFAAWLGAAASDSLLEEARLPGKPGLVGPGGSGAHDDMDLALLEASIEALRPWFVTFAAAALGSRHMAPESIFGELRPLGVQAEAAMLQATAGVNTHRGAIFAMGLLVASSALVAADHPAFRAALAAHIETGGDQHLGDIACTLAAAMTRDLTSRDLGPAAGGASTTAKGAGARLYRELGVGGARGQAEAGFPVLRRSVLPPLRLARGGGESERRAAAMEALLGAMCALDDTCLLSRGGRDGLDRVRKGAACVLRAGGPRSAEGLHALRCLDAELIARHLSPGGSADLLAAGLFLDKLERAFPAPTS